MSQDFKNHWQENPAVLGWFISYLYRKSSAEFSSLIKNYSLSLAQSIVLIGVYRNAGINQRTLSDTIAMAPGVTSRTLRELEDGGYVEKRRDEQNRRNYLLYLTPAGERLAETSLAIQQDYWNDLLQPLSPEEIAVLNDLLRKIVP